MEMDAVISSVPDVYVKSVLCPRNESGLMKAAIPTSLNVFDYLASLLSLWTMNTFYNVNRTEKDKTHCLLPPLNEKCILVASTVEQHQGHGFDSQGMHELIRGIH